MKSSSPKGILSEPVGAGAEFSDLTLDDLVKVYRAFRQFPVYTSELVPPDRIAVVGAGQPVVLVGLSQQTAPRAAHADR